MPTRRALPLLLLLLVVLPLRAQAAEVLESATPDFGNVSVRFTGAALTLTFGANVLASLPLGVGRTALTLLADPVDLPQARTHPHRCVVAQLPARIGAACVLADVARCRAHARRRFSTMRRLTSTLWATRRAMAR
jgi:hypothetical protein